MELLRLSYNDAHTLTFITLNSTCPIEELVCCQDISIYLCMGEKKYLLYRDSITEALNVLILLLHKVIQKQLYLDSSIYENIGYMWNRKLHGDKGFKFEGQFWVGRSYGLWETPGKIQPSLDTWLYNDSQGEIVLEITPTYFWHHREPKIDANYISYEEFMAHYKPLIIRQVSKDVAQQWLEQAQTLLALVHANEERLTQEYEEEQRKKEHR